MIINIIAINDDGCVMAVKAVVVIVVPIVTTITKNPIQICSISNDSRFATVWIISLLRLLLKFHFKFFGNLG